MPVIRQDTSDRLDYVVCYPALEVGREDLYLHFVDGKPAYGSVVSAVRYGDQREAWKAAKQYSLMCAQQNGLFASALVRHLHVPPAVRYLHVPPAEQGGSSAGTELRAT